MNAELILHKAAVLTEGVGTGNAISNFIGSPFFNNIIAEHLPKFHARYGAVSNTPTIIKEIDTKAKLDTRITNYANTKISKKSSVGVEVYSVKGRDYNAFTIPGYHIGMKDSDFTIDMMIFGGNRLAKKFNINGFVDDKTNKIILTSDKKVKPVIFMTSSLSAAKEITDAEKFAIVLHEVGHWSNSALNYQLLESIMPDRIKLIIVAIISRVMAAKAGIEGQELLHVHIATSIIVATLVLGAGSMSRGAEFSADAFAKSLGYGTDLSTSLQKMMGLEVVRTRSELDFTRSIFSKLSVISDFMLISTHPSEYRRSDRLLESSLGDMTSAAVSQVLKSITSRIDTHLAEGPINPLIWAFTKK